MIFLEVSAAWRRSKAFQGIAVHQIAIEEAFKKLPRFQIAQKNCNYSLVATFRAITFVRLL